MAKDLIDEIGAVNVKSIVDFSPAELQKIKIYRWKARYDPMFLGTRILRMDKLITEFTHGPLLRHLQQFPKPTRRQFEENDLIVNGQWSYKPIYENILQLPGPRDRLILYPRGSGKTTLNCELGTVHWLLNYPEISIAIFQASIKKSRDILDSIKQHFVDNPIFRAIFPEYCPPMGAKEFGTQDQFTTPARNLYFRRSRREESVMTAALEAGLTGYHFEVIKFSDVVTSDNTLTEDQIMKVIDLFDKTKYQSISAGLYWRDVEGTRYHFSDLYGHLLEQRRKDIERTGSSPWAAFVGGCWVKDIENPTYEPEELEKPNKLAADGKRISIFPELLPVSILERQEHENISNFRAQMENWPVGGEDGKPIFPDIANRVITAAQFKTQVNPAYNVVMVDSAQTDSQRANHTAIIAATVDRFGRLYVTKILYGKYLPNELLTKIIATCDSYKPLYLILEKSNFNEGLMPGIRREWDLYPHHIPEVKLVPIDNQRKKQLKIKEALQPAYARADYRFVVEWIETEAWNACVREHTQFPKSLNDDILDALTAFYEARTWFGREFDRAVPTGGLSQQEYAFMQHAGIQFLDFDSTPQPANLLTASGLADYYKRTGGL